MRDEQTLLQPSPSFSLGVPLLIAEEKCFGAGAEGGISGRMGMQSPSKLHLSLAGQWVCRPREKAGSLLGLLPPGLFCVKVVGTVPGLGNLWQTQPTAPLP